MRIFLAGILSQDFTGLIFKLLLDVIFVIFACSDFILVGDEKFKFVLRRANDEGDVVVRAALEHREWCVRHYVFVHGRTGGQVVRGLPWGKDVVVSIERTDFLQKVLGFESAETRRRGGIGSGAVEVRRDLTTSLEPVRMGAAPHQPL
jgi:hypothetical protein